MTSLTLGADAAFPFDYKVLPAGVTLILGYLGGSTPHAWTKAEIAAAESTGRTWLGIWTAPNPNKRLSNVQGRADGVAAAAQLAVLGRPKSLPVFCDIEESSYDADRAGAVSYRNGFRAELQAAGYPLAFAYWPIEAGSDWVAFWDYVRPTELPQGVVGRQYQGVATDTRFDLSVFDTSIIDPTATTTTGDNDMLDATDKAWLVAQLTTLRNSVIVHVKGVDVEGVPNPKAPSPTLLSIAKVVNVIEADENRPPAVVDATALAAALVAQLGPAFAAELVAAIGAKLSA